MREPCTAAPRFRPTVALTAAGALAIFYAWPRWLLYTLGEGSPWLPFGYLYGNGLVVFALGMTVILRTGACRPGRGHDRFWFGMLLAGFVFFAALHAAWILAATGLPVKGAQ